MKKWAFVVGAVIAFVLVTLFWLRRFGGTVQQQTSNQDRSAAAEVRLSHTPSALDADIVFVILRSNEWEIGDRIFEASTYGGEVHVIWQDPDHLVIYQKRPEQLLVLRQEHSWNKVAILYKSE
jgi:hypothetical protein